MTKVQRNDPCPCGSGKKYKQCHQPIDRAKEDHSRLLRRNMDSLMAKLIEQTQSEAVMPAMSDYVQRFWNDTYSLDQLTELDDLEDHGSERFLTWVAFDALLPNSQATLVEMLAADPPDELELNEYERELLPTWTATRLRPYVIEEVVKGRGAVLRNLLDDQSVMLRDHAAAKRLEEGEVVFAHLVPVDADYYIAGAVAQATADVVGKLEEYVQLQQAVWQLEHTDSDQHLLHHTTELINHFVMALPREENFTKMDELMLKGRISLEMAKNNLFGSDHVPDEAADLDEDDQSPNQDMSELWADEVDEEPDLQGKT